VLAEVYPASLLELSGEGDGEGRRADTAASSLSRKKVSSTGGYGTWLLEVVDGALESVGGLLSLILP
jgi:hypothetical protein